MARTSDKHFQNDKNFPDDLREWLAIGGEVNREFYNENYIIYYSKEEIAKCIELCGL